MILKQLFRVRCGIREGYYQLECELSYTLYNIYKPPVNKAVESHLSRQLPVLKAPNGAASLDHD